MIAVAFIWGVFALAGCQAQPGLPRPLGPTAGAAVVPSGVPANPTTAANPAGVPGVPQATPSLIAPSTPVQPAGNTPTTPAATAPGATGGVTPPNAAVLQPGAPIAPNQQQKPPAGITPGTPPGSNAVVGPAAGAVNPINPVTPGVVNPTNPVTPGVVNPINPVTPGVVSPTNPVTPGTPAGLNPATRPITPVVGAGPNPIPGPGGVPGTAVNPRPVQGIPGMPGVLAPSPAVGAVAAAQGTAPPVAATAAGPAQPTDTVIDPIAVGPITINVAGTTVRSAYTWAVSKRFSNQAKSMALTLAAGTGTATASYELTVTKSLTTQVVTVAGTFQITGNLPFSTPVLTYAPAPTATPTGAVTCVPANTAPSTCTFSQSWSDTTIAAATGGTLTVTVGTATAAAPYNFAGTTGGTTGNCATITDNFVVTPTGIVTGSNMQMTGNYPPAGLQICDMGDKVYTYAVTFSNMGQDLCTTPITAVNTVTVTPVDGGTPVTDSTTATVTVTGCTAATGTGTTGTSTAGSVITSSAGAPSVASGSLAGSSSVVVSGVQTVIVNTYAWTIENTGGGSSLTTTPDAELTIPFTTSATQALTASAGWVSGSVSISNTAVVEITITNFAINLGAGAASQPLGQCQTTALAVGASTTCGFNVSAPNAPAAGSVTATIDYTPSGGSADSMSSAATAYAFTSAETFNVDAQATLYLTLDTTSLSTITGAWSGGQCTNPAGCNTGSGLVRIQPPDSAPPQSPPGITISQTTVYSYNIIVSKLLTCVDSRTLTNTATLTPSGGQALIRAASATFSVTGCNVLPTVELSNIRTFAAVTWAWTMTKTASPTQYQLPIGSGGSAQYQVQLTRTQSSGNYAMAGTLTIINPANFPMYISSVTLMSTTGSFGALPPACLGGSNVAGSTISGLTGPGGVPFGRRRLLLAARRLFQWATGGNTLPYVNPNTVGVPFGATSTSGSFLIQAGAQIQCQFNISAGTGSAPQGQVYAQATTTGSFVTATGNTAISQQAQVDFTSPTQQWDIGGCVSFSDNAVTQGSAGAWMPQLSALPQQQRICESRNFPYAAEISAVPMTGAVCNQPLTITNTATAVPEGGAATAQATASIQVMATGCVGASPIPPPPPPVAPPPIDTVNVNTLSSNALTAAVQQPVKVAAVGSFEWETTITSDADAAGRVTVAYGSSRAVQYAVTARRRSAFTFYVTGTILVTNPSNQAMSATSVSAQLPSGFVLAACQGGRFPISLPARGSLLCAFNATLTDAAGTQGSVTAVVVSTFGTSTSAVAMPYSLDAPATAPGSCAVLSDSLSSRPNLAASSVSVSGSKPYSDKAQPVCQDASYNFTARFGPFGETDCNMFTVTAEAAATPPDSPSSGTTARNSLQVLVSGCAATAQSVNAVNVVLPPPVGRSIPSVKWAADTQVAWLTTLKYTDNYTLTYNVSWSRADAITSRMSGTVMVTNPTSAAVTIKAAAVQPDFSAGDAGAGAGTASAGDGQSLDATCKETSLAPGASTNCTYTGTVSGGGPGTLVAEVQLTSGRVVSSAATPINLPSRTSKTGSTGPSSSSGCADITTGLFLSPAMVLSNRTLVNAPQQLKACSNGAEQVSLTLGPFSEEACGSDTVVLTTRIRPPAESGQLPFSSTGVAKLVITGCPLSETPKPETIISEGFNVSTVVRYPWRVSSESDVGDTLTLRQGARKDVSVSVQVIRDPGQRSIALQGYVQLAAQGTRNLTVTSVQVGALKRLGELQVVNATCPSESMDADGLITVPTRPRRLQCSFEVTDLPPMDGAIMPLVYLTDASPSPLPNMPAIYRVAGAPRVPLGECAVLGAARSLRQEGADAAVEGQPSSKGSSTLPAAPVCSDFSTTFDMTFGPFGPSECGRYEFTGSVTATPVTGQQGVEGAAAADSLRPAKGDVSFAVVVSGCRSSTRSTGQRAAMDAVTPQQQSRAAPRGL